MNNEEKEKKERRKKILKTVFWLGVAGLSLTTIILLVRKYKNKPNTHVLVSEREKSTELPKEQKTQFVVDVEKEKTVVKQKTPKLKPTPDDRKIIRQCNKLLRILAKDENNKIMLDDGVDWPVEGTGYVPYVYKHNGVYDD